MSQPSVLVVHNEYQRGGGEDEVVRAEIAMLEGYGHRVWQHRAHNDAVQNRGRLRLLGATLWNGAEARAVGELLDGAPIAIAHFHNTFPLISPAAYYAARRRGVAVVQTLHNYRLLCPNALLFRNGRVCEDCVGRRIAWPAIVHACYRQDRAASAATVAMLACHGAIGTWTGAVDAYIALTEFARDKFIAGALPADRIFVKPNFIAEDPGMGRHDGRYGLFVGRLSPEKGLELLVDAWERLTQSEPAATLKIVGAGPLDTLAVPDRRGIEWLGPQPRSRVLALMQEAAWLVLPSTCYEGFPMTIVEAMATGLPVIASDQGSLAELVRDGDTGRLFAASNVADLLAALRWAVSNGPALRAMGIRARTEYEARYSVQRNHPLLMHIYAEAAARCAAPRVPSFAKAE